MNTFDLQPIVATQNQNNNTDTTGNIQTAEQLQQLGHLFQAYIDKGSFKDALITFTTEGVIHHISKIFLGHTTEEMRNKDLTTFLHTDDTLEFQSFLGRLSENDSITQFMCRALKKDGQNCHLRFTAVQSNSLYVSAICEELSELQAANQGKKSTEQILQALLDNSFDMLALIDEKGNYLYVSESFYDNFEYQAKTTLGYKAIDIMGTNCFSYMHPDDLPRINTEFQSLFHSEKKVYSPPFRFKSASGEWRWVEAIVTNQLTNPDIAAIVVSCRDITEQIKTQQQLKDMQLWEALVNGEEKERSRIAKDLHDGVAGMLAAAKMHLSSAHASEKNVATTTAFDQAIRLLEDAATEVRKTSHNLMPELLLQHGLDEALRRYCRNISNANHLLVEYDSWGEMKRYKSNFELSVYRIAQELLNNVVKHSQASKAIVQFHCNGNTLHLTVEDNGIGFAEGQLQKDGMGLCNIRSTLKVINGNMQLITDKGQGVSAYLEFATDGWEI